MSKTNSNSPKKEMTYSIKYDSFLKLSPSQIREHQKYNIQQGCHKNRWRYYHVCKNEKFTCNEVRRCWFCDRPNLTEEQVLKLYWTNYWL